MKPKPTRGMWPGNPFWKQSKALRHGFVVSFRGLREWQKRNPEEAAKVEAGHKGRRGT